MSGPLLPDIECAWASPQAITHSPVISPLVPSRDVAVILSFPKFQRGQCPSFLYFTFLLLLLRLDLSSWRDKQGPLMPPWNFQNLWEVLIPWVELLGHGVESRKECRSTYHFSSWIMNGPKCLHREMARERALGRVCHCMARKEVGWLHMACLIRGGVWAGSVRMVLTCLTTTAVCMCSKPSLWDQ